jgi:hypothetical protein
MTANRLPDSHLLRRYIPCGVQRELQRAEQTKRRDHEKRPPCDLRDEPVPWLTECRHDDLAHRDGLGPRQPSVNLVDGALVAVQKGAGNCDDDDNQRSNGERSKIGKGRGKPLRALCR